jgi:hypothetical protein
MAWIVDRDLDEEVTLARNQWEKLTGKTISKKEYIKSLLYGNDFARNVLETSGKKLNRKYNGHNI